jgi:enoyl-CoA hydratase/carnithine racemase
VPVVTLNRPDKLNAYTGRMGAELTEAFVRSDSDDAIRAAIVTGAGGKPAFPGKVSTDMPSRYPWWDGRTK